MHATPYVAVAAVAAAGRAVAQAPPAGPQLTTPASLVQCQPAQFTVSGGQGPYYLTVIPGGQVGAQPLLTLPQQAQPGDVTFKVAIPAGTPVTIQVRDSTGAPNYTSPITVQPSNDKSCLNGGGGSGGGMGCMLPVWASCDGYTGVAAGTLVPSYNKKSGIWSGM